MANMMTIGLKEVAADKGEPSSTFLRHPLLVESLWSDNAKSNDKQYFLFRISPLEAERGSKLVIAMLKVSD